MEINNGILNLEKSLSYSHHDWAYNLLFLTLLKLDYNFCSV